MLKTLIYSKLFLLLLLVTKPYLTNSSELVEIELPKEVIKDFQSGNVENVYSKFDSSVAKILPPHRLAPIWSQLVANYGEFIGFGLQDTTSKGDNLIINTDLDYEKAIMNFMLSVNKQTNRISGIYFSEQEKKNIRSEIEKPLPTYIDTTKFQEEDIVIKDIFDLKGKLTLPKSQTNKIVFVLVHGSGPNDMDGTLGENKFLKNLAWGLSSIGFSTIRYNKITKRHVQKLVEKNPGMTQSDEYDNSIKGAIEFVRTTPKLKDLNIFLVGHSQGASAITSFSSNNEIKGLILLAGTPRKLYDLYTEQLEYIFNIDGIVRPSERTIIEEHKNKIGYYKNYKKGIIEKDSLPMNLSIEYLRYLDDFNPISNLKESEKPILILNCGHDYQVTKTDFDIWKSNLSSKSNVTLKYLDKLNHIFAETETMAVPADYQKYTPISNILFDEVLHWINSNYKDLYEN